MRSQTIKLAKARLDRFSAVKVYSFEISKDGLARRAGAHAINKRKGN